MCHRCYQINVSHTVSPYLFTCDFYTTFLTYDTLVSHLFVFSAKTLIIINGAKNLGTKESVSLWFEGSIVDGLRLFHLTKTPRENLLWAGNSQLQCLYVSWLIFAIDIYWYQIFQLLTHLQSPLLSLHTVLYRVQEPEALWSRQTWSPEYLMQVHFLPW